MRFPFLLIPLSLLAMSCRDEKLEPSPPTKLAEEAKPFEVLSGKIEPNPFAAGQEVTVTLSVKSAEEKKVMLGANLSSGEKPYYDLERQGDRTVALKKGTHDYSFKATVAKDTPKGGMAIRSAIWQDNNSNGTIDSAMSKPDHDTILWGPEMLGGGLRCAGVANE